MSDKKWFIFSTSSDDQVVINLDCIEALNRGGSTHSTITMQSGKTYYIPSEVYSRLLNIMTADHKPTREL